MPTRRDTPDHEKNDFQNAVKRNLHTWAEWRTMINDRLVDAVLSGNNIPEDVEPFDCYMSRSVRQPNHPTTNPKTLLTYSAAPNAATSLRRGCFYKYGIPRVKLDPVRTMSASSTGNERFGSTSSMSSSESNDVNSHSSNSSLSDEELALDYFYYEKPSPKKEERLDQRRFSNTITGFANNRIVENIQRNSRSGVNGRMIRGGGRGAAAVRSSSCSRDTGFNDSSRLDRRKELTRFHIGNI